MTVSHKQSKITQIYKQINKQLFKSMQSQENTYNNEQTMQNYEHGENQQQNNN